MAVNLSSSELENARITALLTSIEASDFLRKNYKKDTSLLAKRGLSKEITTKYDKDSDSVIIDRLSRNSDYNILTEESGFIGKKSRLTWIVDSLDGTSNYANGNPFFSVSIALADGIIPVTGVINAPFLNEIYYAKRGDGAFMNGESIHVSDFDDLRQSYLLYCEGGDKSNRRIAEVSYILHPDIKDMRKLGSAALEGAYVACGRAEAYITTSIQPWDVAAAVLLVEEAGGKVTDFDGNKWNNEQSDMVFSNGKVHDEILEKLTSLKKKGAI